MQRPFALYLIKEKANPWYHGKKLTACLSCSWLSPVACEPNRGVDVVALDLHCLIQAPKVQASKEAKALAAANSSKGKKKVRSIVNDVKRVSLSLLLLLH